MTKDEALKLALEALEVANSCVDGYYIPKGKTQLPEVEEAITAIREALAQPEQEPVATVVPRQYEDGTYAGNALDWAGRNCEDDLPVGTKLYTTPPQPEQSQVEETLRYEIDALEAKLAECRAQSQQEPVAWMYPDDYERMTTSETFCTVFSVECGSPTQGKTTVALYTTPPHRKPLTDEEIDAICKEFMDWDYEQNSYRLAARAIEAAHGIKGEA